MEVPIGLVVLGGEVVGLVLGLAVGILVVELVEAAGCAPDVLATGNAAVRCSSLLSPSRAVVLAGVGIAEELASLCRGRAGPRSLAPSCSLSPSRAVEVVEVGVAVGLVELSGEVVGLVLDLAVGVLIVELVEVAGCAPDVLGAGNAAVPCSPLLSLSRAVEVADEGVAEAAEVAELVLGLAVGTVVVELVEVVGSAPVGFAPLAAALAWSVVSEGLVVVEGGLSS